MLEAINLKKSYTATRANSPAYMEEQEHIQKKWNQQWGDRLNKLVIIGE